MPSGRLNPARLSFCSDRIYLRSLRADDESEFLKLTRRSRSLYRTWMTPPKTKQEFHSYLKKIGGDDCVVFLVCRIEDAAIVGVISLFNIVRRNFQSACTGYYSGTPFAGKGYMTEAMQLVLRIAFKELKLHRIEANIQPKNGASIGLVKRAGFVKEGYSKRFIKCCGRWADHERWAILSEDWRPVNFRERRK